MSRTFKITVSYRGTHYCGWQFQTNGPSIQAALESAIHSVTCQQVRVIGSGRTDSGVHAIGQVASCSIDTELRTDELVMALNANLSNDIRVHTVESVPDDFHAIYSAVRKRYRYIWQDGRIGNVFRRELTWHVFRELDAAAMHRAAQHLVGEHDFASFQAAGSERATTVRTVHELTVRRNQARDGVLAGELQLEIQANGFLYNMVRTIAGTLVEVGQGSRPESWPADVLAALDRRAAGMTAPPQGLYLVQVDYDS